ncbi:Rieske 2Fe-2S domain-containing protein [Bradyrhizobium sp. 41S5]|nr:Rieske 2Fe-2S domain-containing protein [Bradyrhizobium sp. 41S5]UFX44371.1 Rieske 2Fe-2S domain-containing protein [Bradyrhizobium sp. 41S5]
MLSSGLAPRALVCRARIDASGECRPLLIIVVRTFGNDYFGYVNRCPHDSAWLNIGSGEFFSPVRSILRCGRHGARFEVDTGVCIRWALQRTSARAGRTHRDRW